MVEMSESSTAAADAAMISASLRAVVRTGTAAQEIQIPLLCRQPRAASDRPDRERGQCHPELQPAAAIGRGLTESNGVLGQTGGILTGGQVKSRKRAGEVEVVPERSRPLETRPASATGSREPRPP